MDARRVTQRRPMDFQWQSPYAQPYDVPMGLAGRPVCRPFAEKREIMPLLSVFEAV